MKILMINSVCGVGSTGRICTDLAISLEKEGHCVKIAYGRGIVPEQYSRYAIKIGNEMDVKLHGIKARIYDGSGFGSKQVTKKFIKWIREYNPDIIHLHNIHGYYINIDLLFQYLKESNKKIIWTLHDMWPLTGHAAYCETKESNCQRWEKGCFDCPLKFNYPKTFFDKSEKNWGDKRKIFSNISKMSVIVPSNWLAGLVKKSFLRNYRIKVIHNGIDVEHFSKRDSNFREKYNIREKFVILGVAAVWSDLKGLSDYIKLSKILDDSYKIVLVGLTKKQIKQIPSNILGIQRTESVADLACIYSAADIFVNLTYSDNYPTVNLEAISCELPVLTYNTGGSVEIVEEFGGIIAVRGDIEDVKGKILNFRKNPFAIRTEKKLIDKSYAMMQYIHEYIQIE